MTRRIAAVALTALLAAAPTATAHEGNPDYLSEITAITPATPGVTVEVLNRDDRLLLHNTSGKDVLIRGYQGEPYALVRGDGKVEVNADSAAYYVNEDRFGAVERPERADSKGAPVWKELGRTGRFEWHDHRMHWMSESPPEAVVDKQVRTKIFDWRVPIEVDGQDGAIAGTLSWTPRAAGGPPAAAIAGLALLVLACALGAALIRRRRNRAEPAAPGEAW